MRKLWLWGPLNDESIAEIASCVDKIEELKFDAENVTMHGWEILSTAIKNRPTAVSNAVTQLLLNTRMCFNIILVNG